MNKNQSRWKIESLMTFLVFGLFSVCVLMLLLMGANVYRRLAVQGQTEYEGRTAVQYLTTKVRQADSLDGIGAEEFGGLESLVRKEEIDGTVYKTWIYCYNGYLMELFASADSGLEPEHGDKILEAKDMKVRLEDGLLQIEITTPQGETESLKLHVRSGKEVSDEK